ncbi:MAG: GNAT family N-acetyltransferase [Planctomycetota bacterium]
MPCVRGRERARAALLLTSSRRSASSTPDSSPWCGDSPFLECALRRTHAAPPPLPWCTRGLRRRPARRRLRSVPRRTAVAHAQQGPAGRRRRAADASFEWFEHGDDLESWLADLYELHARRWSGRGVAGSFVDGRRRAFYSAFLPEESRTGRLAFCRLVRDGRTIATQLGVLRGETYYQIQEGYDPTLESERPGTQLRAVMVRRLQERGSRRYDFMEGFTRHKSDWGASLVPCTTLSFALPRLVPRLVFGAKNAVDRYRASVS